jgi:hypothetical protein
VCIAHAFSQQAPHPAHEFRRAAQGLSSLKTLVDFGLWLPDRGRNGKLFMSTKDFDASSAKGDAPVEKVEAQAQPAPPMLWMLLPVALLALLAFLSR